MEESCFTLEDVYAIAAQINSPPGVKLLAVDGRWEAPVSGRASKDYCNIYAIADSSLGQGALYVYGSHMDDNWNIDCQMTLIKVVDSVKTLGRRFNVYEYSFKSVYDMPKKFCLRYDLKAGIGAHIDSIYDNNGANDYELPVYKGKFATHISKGNIIYDFHGIQPLSMYWSKIPY